MELNKNKEDTHPKHSSAWGRVAEEIICHLSESRSERELEK